MIYKPEGRKWCNDRVDTQFKIFYLNKLNLEAYLVPLCLQTKEQHTHIQGYSKISLRQNQE